MNQTLSDIDHTMAGDVITGLSETPKRLSSKYFYDNRGSQLFQDIMHMDTYYLMNCEYEIFEKQTGNLTHSFSPKGKPFNLIEFGAGDGYKTKLLLSQMLKIGQQFTYMPIDISSGALDTLQDSLMEALPDLHLRTVQGEYFEALHRVNEDHVEGHKVILFLGSNIGNFIREQALRFLKGLAREMQAEDRVLIGFDLKKDPKVILPAYSDPWGITRAFNLNLLNRLNRELGADFDLEHWDHFASYDPVSGETKSFILSKKAQRVHFESLERGFSFQRWEPIWTELSQKYDIAMIRDLAENSGFEVVENFYDERKYYLNSLWKLKID